MTCPFFIANVAAWLRTLGGAGVRVLWTKPGPAQLVFPDQVLTWAAGGVVPQPRASGSRLNAVMALLHKVTWPISKFGVVHAESHMVCVD